MTGERRPPDGRGETGIAEAPGRAQGGVPPAAVLRLSLQVLRRHALAFAGLSAALSVAPQLLAHAATGAVERAMAASDVPGTAEGSLVPLALYLGYLGGLALMVGLNFACSVAVTLIGLGPERGSGPLLADVRRTTLRLAAVSVVLWFAANLLFTVLPEPVALFLSIVAGWWALVIPVHAAERPPLTRLAARSWAVLAKGRWLVPALALGFSLISTAIGELYLHVEEIVGSGAAAGWLARAAVLAMSAGVGVVAEVAVVAIYREARRIERAMPPSEVVDAFA